MSDVQAADGRCAGCRLGCSAGAMCRLQMGDVQAADGRCSGCRWAMCRLKCRGNVQAAEGKCAGCKWAMCRLWATGKGWLLGEGNVPDKILYGCASKPDT